VQADFRRGVARIGLLAERLLHEGDFGGAVVVADAAIAQSTSEYWVMPKSQPYERDGTNAFLLRVIRAHALPTRLRAAHRRSGHALPPPPPSLDWRDALVGMTRNAKISRSNFRLVDTQKLQFGLAPPATRVQIAHDYASSICDPLTVGNPVVGERCRRRPEESRNGKEAQESESCD
jgi:hypothetical protein